MAAAGQFGRSRPQRGQGAGAGWVLPHGGQARDAGADLEHGVAHGAQHSGGPFGQGAPVDLEERLVGAHPPAGAAGQEQSGGRYQSPSE